MGRTIAVHRREGGRIDPLERERERGKESIDNLEREGGKEAEKEHSHTVVRGEREGGRQRKSIDTL